jgi:hypothetical protein
VYERAQTGVGSRAFADRRVPAPDRFPYDCERYRGEMGSPAPRLTPLRWAVRTSSDLVAT